MAFFQTKHLWINRLADGVAVLVLDRHQSPTNFFDAELLEDFDHALDAVAQADSLRLLVIRSGKKANFCHGPSPSHLAGWQKSDFLRWTERGQQVCSKLADLKVPSACVVAGTCFDAGLEVALACDHRVVVNNASTSLGFPELEWGMIPCWGSTQRLPHLIGLDNSLRMLLGGQRLDARAAWLCNLADELTEEAGDEPPAFLADPIKRDWSEFPRRSWRQRWLESNPLGRWFLLRGAERILRTRVPEEMPALPMILQALRSAYEQPNLQAGFAFERQALEHIAGHPALQNLLRLLLHREHLRAPGIGASEKNGIRQIGIIVDGTAGLALYLHSAAADYDVVYRAKDKDALALGMVQVNELLQLELQRGTMTQRQLAKILGGFRGTYTWTHFNKLHLILDATEGTMAEKQAFYQEMEKHTASSAIIVPVTSLHRIADLQQGLQHPERMIGLHLIEPWNRGSLAEIVAPASHARKNAQRVREWLITLGKCFLPVPDHVGGLVMRVWLPALNEAGLLVKEGVPIDRIDQGMRRFGMTYGPLEWMDRLGIDTMASLIKAMQPTFAGRITLESGFALMAERQWVGNRVERGFYQTSFRKPKPHAAAAELWRTSQGEAARPVPILSEPDMHAWIQRRLVTLMVLEAVRCLEEGLAPSADDLDCAMCLTGWATHRGGPIGYARQLGIEALMQRCTELAHEFGTRFAPNPALNNILS